MLVRNETFAVAPILPTNVRVIVNQLRKIMPRSETDWLPGSCNETLVQGSRSETLGMHALSKRELQRGEWSEDRNQKLRLPV